MKHIQLFEEFINATVVVNVNTQPDFLQMQADQVGMSREEWIAHYGSPDIGSGIDD
jgi:hypothetical protein